MCTQLNRKLLFSIFNIAARTYSSRIIIIASRSVLKQSMFRKWYLLCASRLGLNKYCAVLSTKSVLNIPAAKMSGGDTKDSIITFEEVKSLKCNKSVLLVDVREPDELKETGIIPGSINIPLDKVETVLKDLPAADFKTKFHREKPLLDTPLVFSCRSGRRSELAQNIALQLGYKNVRNFKGGWLEWEEKIDHL